MIRKSGDRFSEKIMLRQRYLIHGRTAGVSIGMPLARDIR
jgi:hypothetical protein